MQVREPGDMFPAPGLPVSSPSHVIPSSVPRARLLPVPLLLVCLACLACSGGDGAGSPRAGAGPTIAAVGPKGPVRFPFAFEWRSSGVDPDSVFRLTLYDEAERQVFERDTRVSRFDASDEVRGVLASAPRFLWRVAVVDGTGNVVARTDPVAVTLERQ